MKPGFCVYSSSKVGDVLTKTHDKGGLGFGTIGSSLVLLTILVSLVIFTMKNRRIAKEQNF
jgi:uncharacterized membrane-anchored protein